MELARILRVGEEAGRLAVELATVVWLVSHRGVSLGRVSVRAVGVRTVGDRGVSLAAGVRSGGVRSRNGHVGAVNWCRRKGWF